MKLPRISAGSAIVAATGIALNAFTRLWDTICGAIEGLGDSVDTNTTAIAANTAAIAAINNAVRPAFSAHAAVNQTLAVSGTPEKITLGTEDFDTDGCFAASRFTAPVAGYYQINIEGIADDTVAVSAVLFSLYLNGVEYHTVDASVGTSGIPTASWSGVVRIAVGEYAELWGAATGTAPYFRFVSIPRCCSMSGCYLRP